MATEFRITNNRERSGEVIEVLKNGAVCAVIYPDDGVSDLKIVSAHFAGDLAEGDAFPDGIEMENVGQPMLPIPAVRISFDPRRYRMEFGRIVREPS